MKCGGPKRHASDGVARLMAIRSRVALQTFVVSYRWTLAYVPNRLHLPGVLNQRGLVGVGYEIGVLKGEYSAWLLERWRGERLVSVDAWSADLDPNVAQAEHDSYLGQTRHRLARYGDRSEIWRADSRQAAARVPPASADFVYIDARHDYESVSADLAAWLPRVRPGGLLAGHDYFDGERQGQLYGVRRAVDEFSRCHGLKLSVTRRDYPEQSWLVFPCAPKADRSE
jgi:hypothetical protein